MATTEISFPRRQIMSYDEIECLMASLDLKIAKKYFPSSIARCERDIEKLGLKYHFYRGKREADRALIVSR